MLGSPRKLRSHKTRKRGIFRKQFLVIKHRWDEILSPASVRHNPVGSDKMGCISASQETARRVKSVEVWMALFHSQ